jgi:L-fuculose-phosphate aldolase
MRSPQAIRQDVSRYALAVFDAGWVANHDGNVSERSGRRFFITPTATSKRRCSPDGIVECSMDGASTGRGRPPSEVSLHTGAYAARPDVAAVVHAHPPHASAFALVGRSIEPIAMPEVCVSLGERIPLVPLLAPKDPSTAEAVGRALATADVALLAGNGALAVGLDLETAFLRMELLEHYARILSIARSIGEVSALPSGIRATALDLRRKAGLALEGEAPPPGPSDAIRRIVGEEVSRAIGRKS